MDIKILSNKVIMRQLYMAFGIPCIILIVFASILSVSDGVDNLQEYFDSILPVLYISLGFLAAPVPIILIFFGNRYPFTFTLNDSTACMKTRKKQRKKNRIISNLLIFLGLLSGKPGPAGIGLMNRNNNDVMIKLPRVSVVKFLKREKTIYLKISIFEKIYLFCKEENYEEIVKFIEEKLHKKATLIYK